jgi:hypothetical protein
MASADYRFKNLDSLTRAVRWLLMAVLVVQPVVCVVLFVAPSWLDGASYPPEWANAVVAFAQSPTGEIALGAIWLSMYATCAVTALRWIYLANSNAHALGAERMQFTPAWAIGWYFVPLANLWKPYQAMKEVWQASTSRTDWREVKAPALLRWWWALWLLSTSLQLQFDPDDSTEKTIIAVFSVILILLFTALIGVFATIVKRVWAMQWRRWKMDIEIGIEQANESTPM